MMCEEDIQSPWPPTPHLYEIKWLFHQVTQELGDVWRKHSDACQWLRNS